ncbi:MAG: phosphoribosylformylglycinamidine synthase [Chloroflexi bacterium]|nr:phosphoribosylformylglycinamidine synthase [Chloroflexota bacterium]|tara:strand:+ start:10054 stop:10299 length:246 start_codon:yes stop_codon:yes gene_type:complete
MIFNANVKVNFKPGINDPQAISIFDAIHNLGFDKVYNFSTGKLFSFDIDSDSKEKARDLCIELCEKLLSNPVIENYEIEIN